MREYLISSSGMWGKIVFGVFRPKPRKPTILVDRRADQVRLKNLAIYNTISHESMYFTTYMGGTDSFAHPGDASSDASSVASSDASKWRKRIEFVQKESEWLEFEGRSATVRGQIGHTAVGIKNKDFCFSVCERECLCVCLCACVRERKGEIERERERQRQIDNVSYTRKCVWETKKWMRKKERMCVCERKEREAFDFNCVVYVCSLLWVQVETNVCVAVCQCVCGCVCAKRLHKMRVILLCTASW